MIVNIGANEPQRAIQYLERLLGERYRQPAGAMASIALLTQPKPLLLAGTLSFSDDQRSPKARRAYDSVLLLESWIPYGQVFGWLTQVLAGKAELDGCAIPARFSGANAERSASGRRAQMDWATDDLRLSLREDGGRQVPYSPAVHIGLPPFPTISSAVRNWLYGVPAEAPGDLQNEGCLVVTVPDTRGCIVSARLGREVLDIELRANAAREQLQLQVCACDGVSSFHDIVPGPADKQRIKVPPDVEQLRIYLVHAPGVILVEVALSRINPAYGAAATADAGVQQARRDLQDGENDRVEFKPFIEPHTDKERELLETAVAFANSGGGRIYIGADRHGGLLGAAALRKCVRRSLPSGTIDVVLDELSKRLRQLLCDSVRPVPAHSASLLSVDDSPLIVLDIEADHRGPYSTHNNDVYVRKGATNRKPDPRTELPLIPSASLQHRLALGIF